MPTVNINQVNLYYEVAGVGFPVVLCHGYTGSHLDWMFQLPELSKKYKVVAIDLRGHGSSGAPSSQSDYLIPVFAKDIRGLLQHLGIEKCCLAGHSMGGFIVIQFALDYPEMVGALVLMDTRSSGVGDMPGFVELRRKLHQIARTEGMEAAFEYNAIHNPMTRKHFEKHPEQREIAKQKMLQTSVDGYVYSGEAILEWPDLTPRLGEIAVPTICFVGEEDEFLIEPCQVIAEAIPGARLVVVPGVGHSPQEEAPEQFNRELMGFLEEVERSSPGKHV